MNTPIVSVIMAVYNSAEFMEESIRSILNQTLKNFELIVVNDASTDNSLEILEKLGDSDNRIRIINAEKNMGRACARNAALNISKGQFIAIQDADDVALPERLQKEVNFLNEHPHIFLIGSGAKKIDEKGKEIGIHKPLIGEANIAQTLLKKNCIYHSSVMYRNSSIRYREKFPLSQDYDLYLQILRHGYQLNNLPDILISYRIHTKAGSWSHAAKQRLFAHKALEIHSNPKVYEDFNPEEILNLDLQDSTDSIVLSAEIETLFKLKRYKQMRDVCRTYFKHHGYLNNTLLFFTISLFPENIIQWIQKNRI